MSPSDVAGAAHISIGEWFGEVVAVAVVVVVVVIVVVVVVVV